MEPDLPLSLESFTGSLQKLTSKFEADKDYYFSKAYSEAQARVDFITPFFKALGWDMENEAGFAHHAREVLVEKAEEDAHGKPDYSFGVAGLTLAPWPVPPRLRPWPIAIYNFQHL
jgi:hypothetical protein